MNNLDTILERIATAKSDKWFDCEVVASPSEIYDCRYAFDQIYQGVRFLWEEKPIPYGYELDIASGTIYGLQPVTYKELAIFVLYVAKFVYYGTRYTQIRSFCTSILGYYTHMSTVQVESLISEIELDYGF